MDTSSRDSTSHLGEVVAAARSPAAWGFAGVWAAAALVLVAAGEGFPTVALLMGVGYLVWSGATVAITRPADPPSGASRRRLLAQLGVLALVVVLSGWRGLAFHGMVALGAQIPLWSPFVAWLERLGAAALGNPNYLANPVIYLLVPLVFLLATGARPAALGFGRGHRVGRVVALWTAVPVAVLVGSLVSGGLGLTQLGGRFLSHFLQNGLMEEFLFRGALYTRLRRLTTVGWALVGQALVFGVWHLGLGFAATGEVWSGLAVALVNQAVAGLAFGVIFERTRNLAAPTVVHVVLNSLG